MNVASSTWLEQDAAQKMPCGATTCAHRPCNRSYAAMAAGRARRLGAKLGGSEMTRSQVRFCSIAWRWNANTSAAMQACASGAKPIKKKFLAAAAIAPGATSTVVLENGLRFGVD